ncbi:AsmA family protein [Ferrovibrio sp.]|uniref:AsmA family protein n=1 Tax=Ferrovibrio sp. TaxID=1917215 RepID=UPI001B409D23|nr:AsmA family protein [Ferrovibrio sp.]MBP7064221.1 AsmA family protein [Ferrovibrio sp.]
MRYVKWIALALVLLIGAAVAVVLTVDVNRFKPQILAAAEEATGRKLEIAGDLKLNLFPKPAITVKGVKLANAAWGSRTDMANVGEFAAELDLFALLGRQVKVDRLVLADVDVLLEKDKQGRANWEFGSKPAQPQQQQQAASQPGAAMSLPAVSDVTLKNIKLAYRDATTGAANDVLLSELSLKSGLGGILAAKLVAKVDGNDITADGSFGSLSEMMAPSKPWPVKLNLAIPNADLKATVEGSIREPLAGKGYVLKFTAAAPDIAKLAALAKQKAPSYGPLAIAGSLNDQAGEPGLSDLKLSLGSEEIGRVGLSGAVRQLLQQKGVALDVELTTPNAKAFAAKFGAEVAQAVPVKFKANVKDAGPQRYVLSGITADIAGSDLAGSGEIALAGARPAVKFDLASKSLDLTPLLGDGSTAGGKPATSGSGSAAKKSGDKLFSSDPLPLDALSLADADFRFKAEKFKAPKLAAQNVNIALLLKDGVLSLKPFGLGLSGGTLAGEIGLNGKTKALRVKLDGKNIGLSDYLRSEKISDVISRDARTDLAIDLTSQGGSVAALMAGLNGKAVVKVGEGELRDQYLDFLGADMLSVLGRFGQATAKTKLECVVTGFEIKSGVVTPKPIFVETGRITIAGEGAINLATEQLDLKIVPSSRDAALASLAVPIKVGGTLASPSAFPDPLAAAKGVAGALAGAALLGPAAILTPLMSSGSGDADRGQAACAKAVAIAEGKPVPGSRPGQAAPSSNPVENLGRGLNNLFKR